MQISAATYPKRHYESNEQTSLKESHISNDSNQNEDNQKLHDNKIEPQPDNGVIQEDQMKIKMRDLRQKELKLRKWEEQLKTRDKLIKDSNKDRTTLESYITKLEGEKSEQECTIRTLKREIASLESPVKQSEPILIKHEQPISSHQKNNDLLTNIHDKVTNYLLRQVDIQINKLDNMNLESSHGNTVDERPLR